MERTVCAIATIAISLAAAPAAFAASDYLLEIPGVPGESATTATVNSWSFGVCNVGQCSTGSTKREAASGTATGEQSDDGRVRITASQNSQSLRESPTRASTGKTGRVRSGLDSAAGALATGASRTVGDVDGDGSPDLAYLATQDEIYGLSFTVDASGPVVAAACKAGRIETATLSNGTDTFAVSSVSVLCTKGGSGASTAAYARAGINRIDSTPARISTNMTVGKQTQTQSFGERCANGACAAGAMVTITLTGGQMKHTKTGHVTLLK